MEENKINQRGRDDKEVEIDLMELLPYLFNWLWLIVVVGLLTAAIAFAYSAFALTPPSRKGALKSIMRQNRRLEPDGLSRLFIFKCSKCSNCSG